MRYVLWQSSRKKSLFFLINGIWSIGYLFLSMYLASKLITYTELNSRCNADTNMKCKTRKYLEEGIRQKYHVLGYINIFKKHTR